MRKRGERDERERAGRDKWKEREGWERETERERDRRQNNDHLIE